MPPTIQQFMNRLNANERMIVWGAVIVFVASLLGGGWLSLIGSAVVVVLLWLKYAPNQSTNLPAPAQTINLVISAIIAVLALLGLLGATVLGGLGGLYGGFLGGFFILVLVGAIATAIGAVMMALGSWREYQAMPKATPPSTPPTPPAPPAA